MLRYVLVLAFCVLGVPGSVWAQGASPYLEDRYGQIQLARALDQKCLLFSYMEQAFLERAGEKLFGTSRVWEGLQAPGADRRVIQQDWNTARDREVTRLTRKGCADAAAALSAGRSAAYLELAAAITLAVNLRAGPNPDPVLGPLTAEERQLAGAAIQQSRIAYPDDFARLEEAARLLAGQRFSEQGAVAASIDQSCTFRTLRLQAAMFRAGYNGRFRNLEQTGAQATQLVELTGEGKPKLQVVGGPIRTFVPRRAGGMSKVYAVAAREPSGALMVGLYGEDAGALSAAQLRAVLLDVGAPRAGEKLQAGECPFELCFRWGADTIAALMPVAAYQQLTILVTERATNDLLPDGTDRLLVRKRAIELAAANP